MPTMEEIEEGYFNYLTNVVLEAIFKADRYNCKDFNAMKLCFYQDMFTLLQNKKQFEKDIQLLNEDRQKQKILSLYGRK
jgi:hypothetical protein